MNDSASLLCHALATAAAGCRLLLLPCAAAAAGCRGRSRGCTVARLGAQKDKRAFYESMGFEADPEVEEYIDGPNVPHVDMLLKL